MRKKKFNLYLTQVFIVLMTASVHIRKKQNCTGDSICLAQQNIQYTWICKEKPSNQKLHKKALHAVQNVFLSATVTATYNFWPFSNLKTASKRCQYVRAKNIVLIVLFLVPCLCLRNFSTRCQGTRVLFHKTSGDAAVAVPSASQRRLTISVM